MVRNKEQTMKRLLAAAAETIVAQGVDSVAITAAATQAGVNKVLVYRYFRGWNGLLETLFAKLLSEINPDGVTRLDSERIDTLVAQETYVLAFSQLIKDTPAFRILLHWQMDHSETQLGRRLTQLLNESMHRVSGSDAADVAVLRLLIAGSMSLTTAHKSTELAIRHLFAQLKAAELGSEMVDVSVDAYPNTVFTGQLMYIHQYEQLPMDERTDTLLRYGQYLLFREDDFATYILFALGSFFVEIVASKPDEIIERITCFHDTAELQPYLDGFELNELCS